MEITKQDLEACCTNLELTQEEATAWDLHKTVKKTHAKINPNNEIAVDVDPQVLAAMKRAFIKKSVKKNYEKQVKKYPMLEFPDHVLEKFIASKEE